MRILIGLFLCLTTTLSVATEFLETKKFICLDNICFICLDAKNSQNCEFSDDKGVIFFGKESITGYGKGGFVTDACDALAKMYFKEDLKIIEEYMNGVDLLKTEYQVLNKTYVSSNNKMVVTHYLEMINTSDKNNKRLVDVMRCSIENLD